MNRTILPLLTLLLLTAPALGGTQSDPEVSDPSDDRSETEANAFDGALGTDHEFTDTEIIALWVTEPDDETLHLFLETAAPLESNTQVAVSFDVEAGPTSQFGSTADGTTYTIESTGTTLDAGPATGMSQADAVAVYVVPRDAIGAVGGDVITNLEVSTSRSEEAGCIPCTDQTGTDAAPNSGTSRPYTLSRPDIVGAVQVTFDGGTIDEAVGHTPDADGTHSHNGTGHTEFETRDFTGAAVETFDPNATIVFQATLLNTGTDVDTYNLSLVAGQFLAGQGVTTTLDTDNLTLDPGASQTVEISLVLEDVAVGDYGVVLAVNSTHGADTVTPAAVTVDPLPQPPAPTTTTTDTTTSPPVVSDGGRDPMVGEGTFLQDAAEAMGFDEVFGDAAELVLLALILLLLVLLVFLIILLAGGRWIRVTVEPRHATVAPGETAEFQVHVRNRKHRFHDALAYFDGDPSWRTGVLLRAEEGAAKSITSVGQEAEFGLGAKQEAGDELTGTLRVQAPSDAADGERDDITLNVVPTGADGRQRHRKAGRARVRVQADNPGVAPAPRGATIRMSDVRHEPAEPEDGDSVTTTVTLENDSPTETQRLRVVLQLDGTDIEEETVEVPPHSARAVVFPWIAGEGRNRVKVQVFAA